MAKSPQGFIVVLPGEIIEIAQDDDISWLTYQQFGNLVGNLTDIIVEEENWQPMIDAAREMRSPEDYDDKFSTVKNDFLRTWHHSRSANPVNI